MITIPTGDFVGILADVIPLADPDDDFPSTHCVRLEWDGTRLHALATDRYHLGWSTWDPGDEHEQQHQDDLFTAWGGADELWSATVGLDDAKHLVKTYKLGGKEYYVPLTVESVGRAVRIQRSKDTGHSAIFTSVEDTFVEFPDLRKLLAANDTAKSTRQIALDAKRLAGFAKVRPRGPLHMTFTGANKLVRIAIGERFVGAIMPVNDSKDASDVLRHGSGVLLADPPAGGA